MARMPNRSDVEAAVDAAVELGKAQAKALAALPGAITAIAEAARNINATANEARAVIRKAQAVTDRLDSMLDHVEPAVSELTPTLQALKEAQQRIVAMTGSTEKMASFVEDAGAGLSKLAGISGATGLFSRIAAAAKPAETPRSLAAVRAELVATEEHDEPAEEFLAELVETPTSAAYVEEGIEDAELVDSSPPRPREEGLEDADLVEAAASQVPEEAVESSDLVETPPSAAYVEEGVDEEGLVEAAEPPAFDGASVPDLAAEVEASGWDGAETGEVPVSDAETDAALRPVELGSEADEPDVEQA